jgi:hypothetical protein
LRNGDINDIAVFIYMDVVYVAGAGCAGAAVYMYVLTDNCSCVICSSAIHGGRMSWAHDSMDGGGGVMPKVIVDAHKLGNEYLLY